jgi:hypothetical protein
VCDQKRGEDVGENYSCNDLVPVNFCVPPCAPFVTHADCPTGVPTTFAWYTEHLHLGSVLVAVNDVLAPGQEVGIMGSYGAYHFGVTDGQVGGYSGQTVNVTDFYNFPETGTRPVVSPPNATTLTASQISFIKSGLRSPVDTFFCDWQQDMSSASNGGYEYYAIDLVCGGTKPTFGAVVRNFSGGAGVVSVVNQVSYLGSAGYLVVVRHVLAT